MEREIAFYCSLRNDHPVNPSVKQQSETSPEKACSVTRGGIFDESCVTDAVRSNFMKIFFLAFVWMLLYV